jgi:choline dehydrogenase-like flavoprotein
LRNTALHPKQQSAEHDFIIVGSGAGGGPLAANLAKNGFHVLLLEAGGWDTPEVAQVPAFHPHASEHPDLSWEFFVKHYANPEQPDSKWDTERSGIFYPRAATVGGCTLHNAMITICGPSSDWDESRGSQKITRGAASECAPTLNVSSIVTTSIERLLLSWRNYGAKSEPFSQLGLRPTPAGMVLTDGCTPP